MPFFDSLVKVLPQIKTKMQYFGLVIAVAGFIITRAVVPGALSAQISAGAIGILFIVFGQVFSQLGVFPEKERARLILGLFGVFAVFTLSLVFLTAWFGRPIKPNPGPVSNTTQVLTLEFKQQPFEISATGNTAWDYGYSTLERDESLKGKRVKVRDVKVTLDATPESPSVCCDVWIYLGDAPFGFPQNGGSSNQGFPGWIKPNDPNISEIQMVINGSNFSPGTKAQFWGLYNFATFLQKGYPQLSGIKAAKNPEMDLTEGLYAQILVWTGDPSGRLLIDKIKLDVEVEILPK